MHRSLCRVSSPGSYPSGRSSSYNGSMRPSFRDAMRGGVLGGTCLMVIAVVLSAVPGGEAFLCPAAMQRHGLAASSSRGFPTGKMLQQRLAGKARYRDRRRQTWMNECCKQHPPHLPPRFRASWSRLQRIGSVPCKVPVERQQ